MKYKDFLRLQIFSTLLALVCTLKLEKLPTDIFEYFNIKNKDLSNITWGHSANNKTILNKYIQDDAVQMIEGDVTEGTLTGHDEVTLIMAKPPRNTSDVTLKEWIEILIEAIGNKKRKGIKLDFEDINVAITALGDELKKLSNSIRGFPFWLHTNILKGPGAGDNDKIVNSDIFLSLSTEFFPQAVLSLGWTTVYKQDQYLHYNEEMVDQMINTVEKNNIRQPVTFPIRGTIDNKSLPSLKKLMEKVPQGSFTFWSKPTDKINSKALAKLSEDVGADKAFVDMTPSHRVKYFEARSDAPLSVTQKNSIVSICLVCIIVTCNYFDKMM